MDMNVKDIMSWCGYKIAELGLRMRRECPEAEENHPEQTKPARDMRRLVKIKDLLMQLEVCDKEGETGMKISVLIKDPGRRPRHVWIENSLMNLQKTVGGSIETATLAADCVIICNEEGRLMGLPPCCNLCGVDFVGTIVLAGINGDSFADFPLSYKETKALLPELWNEEWQEGSGCP